MVRLLRGSFSSELLRKSKAFWLSPVLHDVWTVAAEGCGEVRAQQAISCHMLGKL